MNFINLLQLQRALLKVKGQLVEVIDVSLDAIEELSAALAPKANPFFTGSVSLGRKAGTVTGTLSVAEGFQVTAEGDCSHASGRQTIAKGCCQTVIGENNIEDENGNSRFIVGCGSDDARANCFRVTTSGTFGAGAWNASGADYAEMFEWADGNPDNEDRVGLFVTLDGDKLRVAGPEDDFILGIVSASPSVVGDVYDDQWQGMYLYDIYGRPIWEDVEIPDVTDRDDHVLLPAHTEHRQRLNPGYDRTIPYIPRTKRPEWDAVGMMGKLVVRDDGSCQLNGWAEAASGGMAAASSRQTGFRVLSRLDECHVKILIL